MIDLNEEQLCALKDETPPQVRNPVTGEMFVLVRREVYEVVRKIVEGPNRRGWDDPELDIYESYRKKP